MYKSYRVLFIIAIIFSQTNIFAQAKLGKDSLIGAKSLSPLVNEAAFARLNLFRQIKIDIIQKMNASVSDFTFTAVEFYNFLNTLDPAKYDGARIYFALSDNESSSYTPNTLYLIFVPTTTSNLIDANNDKESDDDESNAFIISNDKFDKIDLTTPANHFAIKWINRYINKVAPKIESVFQQYSIPLKEAHSLWYSKDVLFDGGNDLKTYLKGLPTTTPMKIDFASWVINKDDLRFSFKMDLLFEIQDGTMSTFLTLAAPEIKKYLEDQLNSFNSNSPDYKSLKKFIDNFDKSEFADTGLPCPPNKCP